MAFDSTPRLEKRLAHGATLPMKQLPRFLPTDLVAVVNQMLVGTSASAVLEPTLTTIDQTPAYARFWARPKTPPTVGLTVNGITVAVTGHDRPAFRLEDLPRIDAGGWQGGRSELARGRAHIEISELRPTLSADLDHNHDRAVAVTIVAAALARLVETIGIVWHASRRCLPADRLPDLVRDLKEGRAPVSLWLSCETVLAKIGRPDGLTTRGLYPLLGAEIEVSDPDLPHASALDIALDLAERVIGAGMPPGHGSRLSFGVGRDFLVRHLPRGCGNEVPVLILVPEHDYAVAGAA